MSTPADKSTPRPWFVNWAGADYWIEDDHDSQIAVLDTQYGADGEEDSEAVKANAHLIVEAVNAYPALLKCLWAMRDANSELLMAAEFIAAPEGRDPDAHLQGINQALRKLHEALVLLSPSQGKPDSTLTASDDRSALLQRDGEANV
jgi:hypothetical protein